MIKSFINLLRRCYALALPYGRVRLFSVLGMIFLNGLLQLVGVTSIFPFFALAADPDRIRNSSVGRWFLHFLPPMSTNHLLAAAGVFSILMLLIASIGSMASEYVRIRYAYSFSQWIRGELMRSYAMRPYGYFLHRNSASLSQRIQDIYSFTINVLLPLGEILTRLVLISMLAATVFYVQPLVAVGAVVLLGGFYLLAFLLIRPRTRKIGEMIQKHNVGFWKNTNQFLHAIKTVFVHGKTRYFIEKAIQHSAETTKYQSLVPIYSNGPRYLIEPIAYGGLVSIVVVLALQGKPFSDILPNLMVMAMAGYRLLPSLQLLFGQLVAVAANNYTLVQLEEEILEIEHESAEVKTLDQGNGSKLNFIHDIILDEVTYRYPGSDQEVINGLSLSIKKNESIGIAGPSGSGKSTLVDLILGLHAPSSGQIKVDGVPITKENIASWRTLIGYVPQDIYLLDDTIAANIAFGIDPQTIDFMLLEEAARGAHILDFIRSLPEGFDTIVGERGVRLSGGQRQRIGVARALYHGPEVLILDEATSALDHDTEKAVMETITELKGKLTIIIIAHRLSTLEHCNSVLRMGQSA
jgi:ABC-type multidrug transport system fused ATPase/permease subunit